MKSIEELNAVKEKTLARLNGNTVRIVVGMATCGIAAGAKPVFDALKEETEKRGLEEWKFLLFVCFFSKVKQGLGICGESS